MNIKNLVKYDSILYMSKVISHQIYLHMRLGSEWVKRDALRAFDKAFGPILSTEDKDRVYKIFTRVMFSSSSPDPQDMIIAENAIKMIRAQQYKLENSNESR